MTDLAAPHGGASPSPWIRRFAGIVRIGEILDVACGTGRHARYFLDRGHPVTAIDRYNAGVVDLLGRRDFELIETDLESNRPWPVGNRTFSGVIVTNYLYRPLFPHLIDAVGPEGCLLYETFALGNERYGRPSNPDFLLRPGELLDAVHGSLEVIAYEHGIIATPRPAVVQRICAVRTPSPGYSAARSLAGGE